MQLPDVEHEPYPLGMSEDAKHILTAIDGWNREFRHDNAEKHVENRRKLEELDREVKIVAAAVKMGYPGGDADGHRRYHEALITREEQSIAMRQEIITHLAKTSTWVMLVGLLGILVVAFKRWILGG